MKRCKECGSKLYLAFTLRKKQRQCSAVYFIWIARFHTRTVTTTSCCLLDTLLITGSRGDCPFTNCPSDSSTNSRSGRWGPSRCPEEARAAEVPPDIHSPPIHPQPFAGWTGRSRRVINTTNNVIMYSTRNSHYDTKEYTNTVLYTNNY